MNRGDLMDAFGVSLNQASSDLNRYIGMAPDNMVYDKSARTYIRGTRFEPLFLNPDASRYLSQLHSVADGILDRTDAWIGPHPELSDTQQKIIALDYGMKGGKAKIPVRRALLHYALKRPGLDTDPAARRARDQQIVLLNAAEFDARTPAQDSASRVEG